MLHVTASMLLSKEKSWEQNQIEGTSELIESWAKRALSMHDADRKYRWNPYAGRFACETQLKALLISRATTLFFFYFPKVRIGRKVGVGEYHC